MKPTIFLTIICTLALFTEGYAQQSTKVKVSSKSMPQPTKSVKKVNQPLGKTAKIKFKQEKIDLGTIKEDAIVETFFEFINDGNADLVIIDAEGSCGCTVPTVPKEPIKPGGKATIGVKYTAKNKAGPQKPIITIKTNGTPRIIKLQLDCWVEQIPGGIKD